MLVSFWDGLFAGAMLVLGSVPTVVFFPKIFGICPSPKPLGKKNATLPPQKKKTHTPHSPKKLQVRSRYGYHYLGFKKKTWGKTRQRPGAWGTMARSTLRMSPETGVGDHLLKPVNLLSRKAQGFSGRKDMKRCKCVSLFVCRYVVCKFYILYIVMLLEDVAATW